MRSLRIAITVDPEIPVPPKQYGGIERIVHLLVCGLVEHGQEVTLFANRDSEVPCRLVPFPEQSAFHSLRNSGRILSHLRDREFDLIHSFGRLAYLIPVLPLSTPKIMSYQRYITPRSIVWGNRLSRGSLQFTACSRHMIREVEHLGRWSVIYNAVCPDRFTFQPAVASDAPLIFLGRIEHIKGTHLAVAVAKRTGRKLILAGNIPGGDQHQKYFESEILPHLDGDRIRYVGPVDDAQKNTLLGAASALLMPILWDEPFGIVMAEALACGTPVIGFRRGSVPEIVEQGRNGLLCGELDDMVEAVARVETIDRRTCREVAETTFSGQKMVRDYLDLYSRVTTLN